MFARCIWRRVVCRCGERPLLACVMARERLSEDAPVEVTRGTYSPNRHEQAEVVHSRGGRVPAGGSAPICSTRQWPHMANEQDEFPRAGVCAVCRARAIVLCPSGIVLDTVKMLRHGSEHSFRCSLPSSSPGSLSYSGGSASLHG